MQYFIKNDKIHKYPVPDECHAVHAGEKLHDTMPQGYEKCDHCFNLPR